MPRVPEFTRGYRSAVSDIRAWLTTRGDAIGDPLAGTILRQAADALPRLRDEAAEAPTDGGWAPSPSLLAAEGKTEGADV